MRVVDAMCMACGAVRKVSRRYLPGGSTRPLVCGGCGHATDHQAVDRGKSGARRQEQVEKESSEVAELLRRREATKALIEHFGVRIEYKQDLCGESEDGGLLPAEAIVLAERGPGWQSWTIYLEADMTLEDELRCLDEGWRNITPAAWDGWVKPWFVDDEDPRVSGVSVILEKKIAR